MPVRMELSAGPRLPDPWHGMQAMNNHSQACARSKGESLSTMPVFEGPFTRLTDPCRSDSVHHFLLKSPLEKYFSMKQYMSMKK